MTVAFCVPTTTRFTGINDILETHLFKILLSSSPNRHSHPIKYYIGFDHDDEVFSNKKQRLKLKDYDIVWLPQKEKKGHVTAIWNNLAKMAIKHGHEYLYLLGDDIKFDGRPFIEDWITRLKNRDNMGFCSAYSGNDNIPTQFFIHKTHYEIFKFVFPPQIENYSCDDWMYLVYPHYQRTWDKKLEHLNIGGKPRYEPNLNFHTLLKMLVNRHKKVLYAYEFNNKNM